MSPQSSAPYNDSSYDRIRTKSIVGQEDATSNPVNAISSENPDVEKVEPHGQSDAVLQATISDDSSYKTLNRWQASFIYITNQVGLGVLSLPTAMQTLGIVPGIITIIGMGLTVTYTAYVLLQFFRRYPTVLNCVDCFRIIGGKPLAIIVGTAFVLNLMLGCASSILTTSIALNSITEHGTCTIMFVFVSAVAAWLLCLPRTMDFMANVGIIHTISVLAAVLIVMIPLGVAQPNGAPPSWDKQVDIVGHPTFSQGFTAVLNIAFAFAGNQGFITVMAEMRDASRDFMPSIYMLQIFAIPMYTIVGAVIYALAGQYTTSPALGAAPMLLAKIAYGVLLPTVLGSSLVFGHIAMKYIFVEMLRLMHIEHEFDRNTKRTWSIWIGIGTTFWLLAFILANAIPVFNSILSISSALFVSWFTFGMSGVMWLYLNWDVQFKGWKKTCMAVINWALIVMTLFFNGVGMWATVTQLLATFRDPSTPVESPFTCADNSV